MTETVFNFNNLFVAADVAELPLAKSIRGQVGFKHQLEISGEQHPGDGLLLARNHGAFIKPCPGQKGSVCCGYWVVEWGMGCPFGCEYCIIQNYTRAGDITLFLNWEDCHREIIDLRKQVKGPIRLGTGQFGDPLALEKIFPLNAAIIDWTAGMPDFTVEIKSKSAYIEPVLRANDARHVTLAFSLNPQEIIDRLEHGAASLEERLHAAATAVRSAGCRLAFHFDPVIPVPDWKAKYSEVFKIMDKHLRGLPVNWISLGTFRFPKGFQEYVEKYHPETGIFAEEFYPSADGKIRYFRPFREEIYSFMRAGLHEFFADAPVYMCMETPEVWERLEHRAFGGSDLKKLLDGSLAKSQP
ncbi:MAG TPA: radical SAM protein [Candidatus Rifleibacterium sp.]|nr:radical SAM protein [Candidatus Rifleibacterium sp.]HPT46032.1 radical SAM protein [Candidatus Rifleibacterium sp.]